MAPTLTATVQQFARVQLVLTWPGIQTVLIERLDPDGTWRPVRGPLGDQLTCYGSCVAYDHEAPLDAPVSYRVTSPQGSGAVNSNIYFESGISPWIGANGGTVASSGTQHHEGALALRLTPDGTTAATNAQSEEIAVTVGTTYGAAAWVRATAASTWGVGIAWYNASHTFVSASLTSVSLAAGVWTFLTGSGAAPATAAFGRLLVQATGTPASSNLVYVDEAVFTSPAPLTVTAGPVTVDSGGKAWLSHPGHPRFTKAMIVNDFPASYPGRSGSFQAIGAELPIAITDVRGGAQGSVTFQVMTQAEYLQMRALIADGGVLLLRTPATWGGDTWYILAGDIAELMPTGVVTDGMRRYQMPFTRVDRPGGGSDGAVGHTWADVKATYATWAALTATGKTWAALAANG